MNAITVRADVRLQLLPFGCAWFEVIGAEPEQIKQDTAPAYGEPPTTGAEIINLAFGSDIYAIPKTTNGFL